MVAEPNNLELTLYDENGIVSGHAYIQPDGTWAAHRMSRKKRCTTEQEAREWLLTAFLKGTIKETKDGPT